MKVRVLIYDGVKYDNCRKIGEFEYTNVTGYSVKR